MTSSNRKREQSKIDRFLNFDDEEDDACGDELDRYLSLPREKVSDPLVWWRSHKESYPVLSRLAFDLGVPAMSSECERVFSKAGRVVTDERNRISDLTLQEGECLKSWHNSGLITIAAEGLEEVQEAI